MDVVSDNHLEAEFTNIEDISDPSHMEKIMMIVDSFQIADEEFMELLLGRHKNMIITWEQPWYQHTNVITRPLKDTDDNNIGKYRTDHITKKESDSIKKNWRKFRKSFDVPDTPICLARWKNKYKSRSPKTPEEFVRHYVAAFLARRLERTLKQVYDHFTKLYSYPNKGAYGPHEENIMEICFYHCPKKAVIYASKVLGREPRGIYKKLQQLGSGKPVMRRLKWTLPLASKFLNLLMMYTGLTLDELKNKQFNKAIWMKLENDMEQNYSSLQKFWYNYLHVQIFVKFPITLRKLRKQIYRRLRDSSYFVWTDIRWKDVAASFPDGFTYQFLRRMFLRLVAKNRNYMKLPLNEVLDYATKRIPHSRNARLKSLTLNEDGCLELIDYTV